MSLMQFKCEQNLQQKVLKQNLQILFLFLFFIFIFLLNNVFRRYFNHYITHNSITALRQKRSACSVLHLPAIVGPVWVMSGAREAAAEAASSA